VRYIYIYICRQANKSLWCPSVCVCVCVKVCVCAYTTVQLNNPTMNPALEDSFCRVFTKWGSFADYTWVKTIGTEENSVRLGKLTNCHRHSPIANPQPIVAEVTVLWTSSRVPSGKRQDPSSNTMNVIDSAVCQLSKSGGSCNRKLNPDIKENIISLVWMEHAQHIHDFKSKHHLHWFTVIVYL